MPDEEFHRQRRGEESRQALLQAGVELLQEETLRDVLGAISSRNVAKTAHRSAGSFFHHWQSAEAYVDDLIAYIFRAGLLPENIDGIAERLVGLLRGPSDPVTILHAILDDNFADTVNDPFFPVELLLRSRAATDRVRSGLRTFYRETERIIPVYDLVASSWDAEPRPPFDYETMSVALTALLEGLALRSLVDPDRVPSTLYGDLVLAFLTVVLRQKGDTETTPDRVTAMVSRRPPPAAPQAHAPPQ